MTLGCVQNQLKKLEAAGLLTSKRVGRTRLFQMNPKCSAANKLTELMDIACSYPSLTERE